jgi:RHS repeat-associated protein
VVNWRPANAQSPTATMTVSQYSQAGQLMYQVDHGTLLRYEHVYLAGSLIATREAQWYTNAAQVKYQHTDALGSPVAVTNESGTVIERLSYEPYGAIIGKPQHNGIGYTGHVMDAATGLTYMQQRYYDQSIGRFLSVDPVTANGGTGVNFNRYKYAANNPYRFVDPDGRVERDKFSPKKGNYFKDMLEGLKHRILSEFIRIPSSVQKELVSSPAPERLVGKEKETNGFGYGTKLAVVFVFMIDMTGTGGGGGVAYIDDGARLVKTSKGFLTSITREQAVIIQNIANKRGVMIDVIGSRARGNAHSFSDWDYVITGGNARNRSRAFYELPRGGGGGDLRGTTWTGKQTISADKVYDHEILIRFEPRDTIDE